MSMNEVGSNEVLIKSAVAWRYTDASGTHFTDDFNDIQDSPGIEEWTTLYEHTKE